MTREGRIWIVVDPSADPGIFGSGCAFADEDAAREEARSSPELVVVPYVRQRRGWDAVKLLQRLLDTYPKATIQISRMENGGTSLAIVMLKDATASLQCGETAVDVGHAIVKLWDALAETARKRLEESKEHARRLGLFVAREVDVQDGGSDDGDDE